MKHSTTTPTREESAYIAAAKTGSCVVCEAWARSPASGAMFVGAWGGDFHHFTSGGRRISHLHGICACPWHHRGVISDDWHSFGRTHAEMREYYGPSLMDGSKTFHDAYGSDAELLALQDDLLRQRGITPPVRPDNRRWSHAA